MQSDIIYLASPYTSRDFNIRQMRYEQVKEKTALLLKQGFNVFSPIVYTHPMATEYAFNDTSEYWLTIVLPYLKRCDQMWIYMMPGWQDSHGIAVEVETAEANNIPVRHLSYDVYPNNCPNCED